MYRYSTKHSIGADHPVCGNATLMIPRCGGCDKLLAPPSDACGSCRSVDLEWIPASGCGSIVSWRVLEGAVKSCAGSAPSTIAIVELDEGPWIYTTIEGPVPPSSPRPVRVRFEAPPRGDRFPVFTISG
ncbi:Zn-ribbon domain-containing OB-fold protein [Nocardia xishanensis]|uniref:Zn-ribbon domain-containing OB-fold protein n=1 Tax=Nocardia xishanensis TaxID=238964 RepID=UPI00341463C3